MTITVMMEVVVDGDENGNGRGVGGIGSRDVDGSSELGRDGGKG